MKEQQNRDFRALIKDFQVGGKRDVIDHILNLVEQDLLHIRYKGESPDVDDPFVFVAYRIKSFMLKNHFKRAYARNITENSHKAEDYAGLHDFIYDLYEAAWIPLDFDAIERYDFQSVIDYEQAVKEHFGSDAVYTDFMNLIDKFESMNKYSKSFKEEFEETKHELLPLFISGLELGLLKIDVDRESREIVTYLNKVMLTSFINEQIKVKGIKRIVRRGNKSLYVKMEINDIDTESDAWKLILGGKTLKHVGLSDSFKLTKTQKDFLLDVHKMVKTDLAEKNVDVFWWTHGQPILKKRYLAERLGIREANFKKRLRLIEKKIHENWQAAIESSSSFKLNIGK